MKSKYLYCKDCEAYTKFEYISTHKIEGLTNLTNDVLVMYECNECHLKKPQVENMLEKKLKKMELKE